MPSVTTIWRVLKREGLVTAGAAQRRERSSLRFEADLPNETWQGDVTHWALAECTDAEILTCLDDHSRSCSPPAHARVTGDVVVHFPHRD